jgi:hypothetical protein
LGARAGLESTSPRGARVTLALGLGPGLGLGLALTLTLTRVREHKPAPCTRNHHIEPPRIRHKAQRVAAVGAHLVGRGRELGLRAWLG